MVFDGPSHTGASAALPEGDHTCCDTVMPLNDALESVNVTPATGLISKLNIIYNDLVGKYTVLTESIRSWSKVNYHESKYITKSKRSFTENIRSFI